MGFRVFGLWGLGFSVLMVCSCWGLHAIFYVLLGVTFPLLAFQLRSAVGNRKALEFFAMRDCLV